MLDTVLSIILSNRQQENTEKQVLHMSLQNLATSVENRFGFNVLLHLCFLPSGAYAFELDDLLAP
jgi:hypothetical protein